MSSKSDNDNRSNQLNPNNSAYHSSRSHDDYDGNDDEGSRTFELADCFPRVFSVSAEAEVVFYIGLVNDEGDSFLVGFSVKTACNSSLEKQANYNQAVMDAEDIGEKILRVVKNDFEFIWSSPLMFSALFGNDGYEYLWMSHEYRPGSNPNGSIASDRRWAETGEKKVRRIRELVSNAKNNHIENWGTFDLRKLRRPSLSKEHWDRISELMVSGLLCCEQDCGRE